MLLEGERKRLLELIATQEPTLVLSVQDTTEANFSGKRSSKQLGATTHEHKRGIFLHNHLVFSESGSPLGLFDQHHFSRAPESFGTLKAERKKRAFGDKESHRWVNQFELLQSKMADFPSTKVVDICDREGDIHELLQARHYEHVHYLVRSRGDRKARGSTQTIRQDVARTPVLGTYELEVRDQKGQYVRTATLSIRATRLTVDPRFKSGRTVKPTTITVLLAAEEHCPEGAEALNWLLITSLEVNTFADALKIVGYYALRWRIEVFHYILKQGYQIEDLQLKHPQAVQNAIALHSCLAVQILRLRYGADDGEKTTMQEAGLDPVKFKVAALYLNKKANAKYEVDKKAPTMKDFITVLAHLGGSLLWKNKPIGIKVLWRGILLLEDLMEAYHAFRSG